MAKGKAFFVVGHKSWGKSDTLEALTDGNHHFRYWTINEHKFFIRRMSDDDYLKGYEKFASDLDPDDTPHVLAALCPRLVDKDRHAELNKILNTLKRSYALFFFVLRNKGDNPEKIIPDDEIQPLDRFGTVKVYRNAGATAQVRAKALEGFIKKYA